MLSGGQVNHGSPCVRGLEEDEACFLAIFQAPQLWGFYWHRDDIGVYRGYIGLIYGYIGVYLHCG